MRVCQPLPQKTLHLLRLKRIAALLGDPLVTDFDGVCKLSEK